MRISRLALQNIGVFENELIEFRPKVDSNKAEIHILTGKNGTGKSTILYALANGINLLDSGLSQTEQILLPIRNRSRHLDNKSCWGILFDEEARIVLEVNGKNVFEKKQENADFLIEYFGKQSNFYHNRFAFSFFAYSGMRNGILFNGFINEIQESLKSPFLDSLNFYHSIDSNLLVQWIATQKTKEALAFIRNDSQNAEKYRLNIKRLEIFISDITKLKVEFILEDNAFLKVSMKINEKIVDLDTMPDGLKSILTWIGDLLMRLDRIPWENNIPILERNFVLFLDEIEVHLHPAWQRKILPVVQKLFPNAQIFISTHSPFVVGSVDNAWVYKLEGENGNAKVSEVRLSKASESYQLVLDEVFDIKESFGEEVEQEFRLFYELKKSYQQNDFSKKDQFLAVTRSLLNRQSIEIEDIISFELRQLERQIGEKIEL
jgi:predicted ATP-binding protein involved in virulence